MLPVAGAKGKCAFVASTATSSMQIIANELEISEDEKEESSGKNVTAGSSKEVSDHMDVDQVDTVPLESLLSSSKHKHSHIDNNSTIFTFGGTSSNTTAPSTSMASSMPANKKLPHCPRKASCPPNRP
jgi:hypothetical protein